VNELRQTGKIAKAALSDPLDQNKQRRYEQMTQLAEIFADIYAETLVERPVGTTSAMPFFKEAA
jgi:hypothetical protein